MPLGLSVLRPRLFFSTDGSGGKLFFYPLERSLLRTVNRTLNDFVRSTGFKKKLFMRGNVKEIVTGVDISGLCAEASPSTDY